MAETEQEAVHQGNKAIKSSFLGGGAKSRVELGKREGKSMWGKRRKFGDGEDWEKEDLTEGILHGLKSASKKL